MKKERLFNITLFILIFITILSIILLKPIGNLDEIWNYNFARNISNGLVPYRDFNMVTTPLLSMVCGFILSITYNQLIVMRILAAILCSLIIYIIYRIFYHLNIKREVAIIFTFIIGYLFKDIFCIDYNWATLLLVLLIIYNEIKIYKTDRLLLKDNIKSNLFLGILAGLTLTLKQTTGVFICAALLGNKLLFIKNKEELKLYFKSFIYRLIGVLIPILIMIIYLICNEAFNDFVSYAIKGVSGFSNYISYKSLIGFNITGGLAILVPITFIFAWYKSIIKEKDKNVYFLLVYGLAMFIVAFPISDNIHFLIGATPTIILILYELYNICIILYNKFLNNKKAVFKEVLDSIIYFIDVLIILALIIYATFNLYNYLKGKKNYSNLNYYKYIIISESLENQIKLVDNFILDSEKTVKILDAAAAVYMIPIDKYNKDYDMLNKGNLGENGEQKIINEIEENRNIQYLMMNDKYKKNWQTPINIIEYVQKSKNKIREIGVFDIYE